MLGSLSEAQELLDKALKQYATEWQIGGFGRVGGPPDPNDYYWDEYLTMDDFGATVENMATGQKKVLGRKGDEPRGYPAIPGLALEEYRDGKPNLIISYLERVGLIA